MSPPSSAGTPLTVTAISVVPDPKKVPYANCLVHFVAEKPDGARINAVAWAFRERKLTPAGTLKPGDRLYAELQPYDDVAASLKREMAAADAADLDLPEIWLDTIYQINGTKPAAGGDAPGSSVAGASEKVERIHRVLAAHGDGPIGGNGAHDWLFRLNYPELHSPDFLVPSETELQEISGPLPVIVDFKNKLAEHGIGLVFVVAPLKAHLFPGYATNLPYDLERDGRIDLATEKLIASLREQGVHAVDCLPLLGDSLWEEYAAGKFTPVYPTYDHHWSSFGAKIAADAVVAAARSAGFAPDTTPPSAPHYTHRIAPPKDELLAKSPSPGRQPHGFEESYWVAPSVGANPDGADVLLLGDSFARIWEDHGASFGHHLSAGFGQEVATIVANGASATYTRQRLARSWGEYKNLKLVVWEVSEAYLADKPLWQPVELDGWIDLANHIGDAATSGGTVEPITAQSTLRNRSAGLAFSASPAPVRLKWTGVKLGDAPKLVTTLCHPLVEGAPVSDGVTFAVYVDGKRAGYRGIRPPTKDKPNSFAKQWGVPLGDFAGRTVDLELVVEPRGNADGDRGIWVEPTILNASL